MRLIQRYSKNEITLLHANSDTVTINAIYSRSLANTCMYNM